MTTRAPVSLSKDQQLTAKVISYLDMGVIAGSGMLVALGLLFYGRFSLRRAVEKHDRYRQTRYSET